MHAALERFYRAYYLRPRPILRIVRDMLRDREVMRPPPARGARVLLVHGAAAPAAGKRRRAVPPATDRDRGDAWRARRTVHVAAHRVAFPPPP